MILIIKNMERHANMMNHDNHCDFGSSYCTLIIFVYFLKRHPGILVSKTSTGQEDRYSNRWKACGCYAHLAAANSMQTQRRVSDIRQMLQDKYNRQLSGNLYQAYRKMAHYSNAVDPHSKCVYPHHLAIFIGELGVPVTEKDACILLHREVSAKSLNQPFGMATFHAVATGQSLQKSKSFTTSRVRMIWSRSWISHGFDCHKSKCRTPETRRTCVKQVPDGAGESTNRHDMDIHGHMVHVCAKLCKHSWVYSDSDANLFPQSLEGSLLPGGAGRRKKCGVLVRLLHWRKTHIGNVTMQCIAMSRLSDFRTVIHSHWNCRANEHCYWNWLETWKGRKEKKTHTRQIRVFTFFFWNQHDEHIFYNCGLETWDASPNEKKLHVDLPLLSGLKPWFRAQSPFVRYRNSRLFRYHH